MIPEIGFMIAAYIGFRMIEVMCFRSDRYYNDNAKIAMAVLAAIVLLIAAAIAFDLLTSGNTPSLPTK